MDQRYSAATDILGARRQAEGWLTRFAPVLEIGTESPQERLKTVQALQKDGERVLVELSAWATQDDQVLLTTVREALAHLKSVEEPLKRTLQGSSGTVNLTDLRSKIAEAAARTELGSTAVVPEKVELALAPGSLAAAGGMGLFSLAWLSFTTFHATLMIGGMWKAFGPVALFLLAFYSLFFGVGFMMARGALEIASSENLELFGRTLVLRKKLGFWVRERRIELGPQSRVSLEVPTLRQKGSRAMALSVNDLQGKQHQFGLGAPEHLKSDYVRQLNASLAAQGAS
ncbi:hypothetical protein [Armatimonas rosea]|uniref:Uncharacterized protein n=1 Tax=Armatimonas rosea TaxID=685828 RepID=A0A7W9W7K0_ARMRO|nr:hypothetical protein [Armatimonas rosea]MBB6052549.1 hypothetical protein [Armatimonas rosea]